MISESATKEAEGIESILELDSKAREGDSITQKPEKRRIKVKRLKYNLILQEVVKRR